MSRLFLKLFVKYLLHRKQTFLQMYKNYVGLLVIHIILLILKTVFLICLFVFFRQIHKPSVGFNYIIWTLSYCKAAHEL